MNPLREIITNGLGTSCFFYKFDGYALKIERWNSPTLIEEKLHERELVALEMIQGFDWAPKVLGVMKKARAILMKDAGERLTIHNMPSDAIDQITRIYDDLESIKLRHDDVRMHEFVVDSDGKITLCDWGWCSMWVDKVGGERDPSPGGHEGVSTKLKPLHCSKTKEEIIEIITNPDKYYDTIDWRK